MHASIHSIDSKARIYAVTTKAVGADRGPCSTESAVTLAAPGAAHNEARRAYRIERRRERRRKAGEPETDLVGRFTRVLPRRPVVELRARAGLLALGSSYSPRLPNPELPGPVVLVGFVPDHSDGVAADSHRLPWDPSRP